MKGHEHESIPELNSMMRSVTAHIGDFEIIREINKGSNAHVFQIKTVKDGKYKALKTIWRKAKRGDCKEKREEIERRVSNQRKIHQSIRNRYIVELFRYFKDPENFYFMLEYCQKGDLAQFIKNSLPIESELRISKVKEYGLQIARSLSYLHSSGIIHGDLKPENILLTCENEVKLCDFEHSVKMENYNKVKLSRQSYNRYVAPEIIQLCTEKIDIWAFGCILYEIATGKTPFSFSNLKEMSVVVTEVTVKRIKFGSNLTIELKDLLEKMLNYDQSNRISIDEVIKHPFFTGNQLQPFVKVQKMIKTEKIQKRVNQKSANNNKQNQNQMNMHMMTFNEIIQGKITGSKQIMRPKSTIKINEAEKKGVSLELKKKVSVVPFSIQNLKIKPIILGKVMIKIDQNGLTRQEESQSSEKNLYLNISSDGRRITIRKKTTEKQYLLENLPEKYIKYYEDCRKIVDLVKNETPKLKFQNTAFEIIIMFSGRLLVKINGKQYSLSERDIIEKKFDFENSIFEKILLMKQKLIQFNESM